MPPETVIVVSDAHLGHAPPSVAAAFGRFLAAVPSLGQHLVINGDLFDFWFEYRRVISREAFPTLVALAELRKEGVALTVTGGNHDRWGGGFWSAELGAPFHANPVEIRLAGLRTFLAHGDGLVEPRRASRVFHYLTRLPIAARAFGWIHPDIGYWLADRLSGVLAESRDGPALDQAAAGQERFALGLLERRMDLDLILLGHSHRPALRQVAARRWYLNPGPWIDGCCYAVITPNGPELRRFA